MKYIFRISFFIIFLIAFPLFGQNLKIEKVEPPNWWAGMKYNSLQLMIYGENLNGISVTSDNPQLSVAMVHEAGSPSYSFVDIKVTDNINPGNYKLKISQNGKEYAVDFPIYERNGEAGRYQGFGKDDIVYLITPDRFCDGDTANESFSDLIDGYNPASGDGRHGGDIQGIINSLDYVAGLGVTAIWINPMIENNTQMSYHGYGATDLYNIDKRFGSNALYTKLVAEAHKRGLKVILDHINNHIGSMHRWMFDLPTKDWFNGSPENPGLTPHEKMSIYDIHQDSSRAQLTMDGWFVKEMPDMNQKNEFVAKYLIQNTLWWIESTGLDGIREDTYPYSDQKYLSEWAETIFEEYPNLNIVGEVWLEEAAFLAPYQAGSRLNRCLNSNLPSLTDFGLYNAFWKVFDQHMSIYYIYETLAKDFLFEDPDMLMTFVDNHDLQRIMHMVKGDERKFKLALKILLTTRGIPQLYYGTEIGMNGGPDHPSIREDFPGGFPGDKRSAFTKEGRTAKENEIFNFTKRLIDIRKNSEAIKHGKLIHYLPYDELYCYIREYKNEQIAVFINNKDEKRNIDLTQFPELKNAVKFEDLELGRVINVNDGLMINEFEGKIYKVIN